VLDDSDVEESAIKSNNQSKERKIARAEVIAKSAKEAEAAAPLEHPFTCITVFPLVLKREKQEKRRRKNRMDSFSGHSCTFSSLVRPSYFSVHYTRTAQYGH